ncbi:RidA family protein [Nocardia africana]|uniref:RidA family protein n=1 Tax=Nocardia africana TaxID=134964 RepID=A0ABW6NEF9_9NOCA
MSTDKVTPPPAPAYATAGPWIVLSGQVGVDHQWRPVTESFVEEAQAAFENVFEQLRAAGTDRSAIVKVTAYLSDFSHFDDYNAVWAGVFKEHVPARTTIQAGLHPPFRVELDVIAFYSTELVSSPAVESEI